MFTDTSNTPSISKPTKLTDGVLPFWKKENPQIHIKLKLKPDQKNKKPALRAQNFLFS